MGFLFYFAKQKHLPKKIGDAGYRSPYLSHAKQALYHLSYIPTQHKSVFNHVYTRFVTHGAVKNGDYFKIIDIY